MELTRLQWIVAILAAAGVHLLVLAGAWLLATPAESPSTAPRGVMVSLDSFDAGPPPTATNASQTPTEAATPADAIPQAPIAGATPAPKPAAQAQTAAPEAAADIGPDASSDATTSHTDTATPQGQSATAAEAVTVRSAEVTAPVAPEEQAVARAIESGPESEIDRRRDSNGAFGNSPETTDDYIVQLRAWLSRHKVYPQSARRDGVQGTVALYLVIDSQGNVVRHRIQRSSGADILDRAAKQMLERAEPLPRMPADSQRNRMELVIPITFTLE